VIAVPSADSQLLSEARKVVNTVPSGTPSVYRRYRIVTGDDLREAVAKLNAESVTSKVPCKVAAFDDERAALSS
jgi:hypothetical protein